MLFTHLATADTVEEDKAKSYKYHKLASLQCLNLFFCRVAVFKHTHCHENQEILKAMLGSKVRSQK
jgi:hypothetical protein